MTTLGLSLFGGFSARIGDVALTFPTRKAQALLAYLALAQGRAFEREQLCTLLWGETGREQAQSSLRQTLFGIRKTLPAELKTALIGGTRSVALDAACVHVDALELSRVLQAHGAARQDGLLAPGTARVDSTSPRGREELEQLVALYKGPLLEGIAIDEIGFEEWLSVERSRFADLASGALLELAQLQLQAGALQAAVQTRLTLSRLAPWDEDNHRGLMQLYARQGRRSAALSHYRQCAEVLRRDLGVEPEALTKRLYQELASGETATLDSGSKRLSSRSGLTLSGSQTPALVRRERELTLLRDAMAAAWCSARTDPPGSTFGSPGRVALLIGEAGVGKTRLLDELSAHVVAEGGRVLAGRCFESEQVLPFAPWVSALRHEATLTQQTLCSALTLENRAALARLLSRGEAQVDEIPPQENALRLFEAYLALLEGLSEEAPLLVLLDDLHWADDMSLRLLSFLGRRLSGAQASRARIFIAASLRKEELARGAVLVTALSELAREAASLSLPIEPLSESDTSTLLHALTGDCQGPLDARVQAQIWSLSEGNPFVIVEAARALTVGALVSDESGLPVPERVREVIAGHIARLSPFEQQLTALAAVIGREFELGLLCAASEHEAVETASAVEALVRAGVFKASRDKLYFSHERIREVVYENLLPQRRGVLHGHVARTLLSVHAEALSEVYGSLAFHFAKAEDRRAAVSYFAAFADHAAAAFGIGEALNALAEARVLAASLPPSERAPWLLELDVRKAKCLFHLGRFAEIKACLAPHVPLLDTLQRPDLKAQVYFWVGCAKGLLGDIAAAASDGEHALEEALRCGGIKAARRAHTLLAWEAAYRGRFDKGIEHGLAATVSLASADAEVEYQATGFMTAGINYLYLGRHRQALDALETAAALARDNGVARVQALSLAYSGLVQAELAHETLALALCAEAVALAPDPLTATGALSLLLHVHVRAGRTEQARATFRKRAATAPLLGPKTPQAGILIALAEAQLLDGFVVEARDIAREALGAARAAAHPLIEGAALRLLGQSALWLGEPLEAQALLDESRNILAQIGAAFQLGRTLCALSALARQQGDTWRAKLSSDEAERLYHSLELPLHAARVADVVASMGCSDRSSLQQELSH